MTDDREARFRALFEAGRSRLGAYALRRTSSSEDTADILAETFLLAWQRLESIPEGDAAVLWLYATARNVLANHRRRQARAAVLVERLASEMRGALCQSDPLDESGLEAARVLASLVEEDREILMLAGAERLAEQLIDLVKAPAPGHP